MAFFEEGLEVQIDSNVSNALGGVDRLEGRLMDVRGAVLGVGFAMAGLSAGGLVGAAKKASEFEDQMADVEKVTDPETAAELADRFQDLGEQIPVPVSELAKLGEQAGKFGAEGPDEIENFVEAVGKIQTATDLSAEVAGKRFAKIGNALGVPLSQTEDLGNAVNALADSMQTDTDEITDATRRSGNILSQQLGLGEDAVLALNASMNEVSPTSRLAASSLERMARSLMDPKKVEDLAEALGMTPEKFREMREQSPEKLMNQVSGEMADGGDTANDLRGTLGKAATDFSKLGGQLSTVEEAQGTVNDQLDEGTSLQREMEIRTGTLSGQMQILRNKIGNVARSIGDVLLPHLTDLLGYINDAVDVFSSWNSRSDGLAATAVLLGGLTTGLIMVTGALASFAPVAGAAAGAVGALGTVFGALTVPIALAIAAVAALGVAWQRNLFGIQDKTGQAVSGIRSIFNDFLAWFGPLWDEHFSETAAQVRQTAAAWQSAISGFVEWATPFLEAWFALLQATWELFGDDVIAVATYLFDALRGIVEFGLNAMATQIQIVLALLRGDWEEAWTLLAEFSKDTLDGLIDFVGKWGSRLVTRIVEIIKGAGTAAASAFKDAFNEGIPDTVDIPGAEVAGQSFGGGSIELPSLDTGGMIRESGVAEVHAGERVVPAEQVGQGGGMARELADALSGLGDQQVRVIFEGGDAITEAVQREARVVVERNNEQTRRKIRRLQERG
jgi:TP901 family phage tail tape measure protein